MNDITNKDLDDFSERIGYRFSDRSLLIRALTHSSKAGEEGSRSNERLEFLGDAVLSLVISAYIFSHEKLSDEGGLSRLRALIVRSESLSTTGRKIGLDRMIRLGRSEEVSGGRNKRNIIEDAFESLVGAVYLDGGYDAARDMIFRVHSDIIEEAVEGKLSYDYKTVLQEKVFGEKLGDLSYVLTGSSGPDHRRVFESAVCIAGKMYPSAKGMSKKESEQNAARIALEILKGTKD